MTLIINLHDFNFKLSLNFNLDHIPYIPNKSNLSSTANRTKVLFSVLHSNIVIGNFIYSLFTKKFFLISTIKGTQLKRVAALR